MICENLIFFISLFTLIMRIQSINSPALSPFRAADFNISFDCIATAPSGDKFALLHKESPVNLEITYFQAQGDSFRKIGFQTTYVDGQLFQISSYDAIWSNDNTLYYFEKMNAEEIYFVKINYSLLTFSKVIQVGKDFTWTQESLLLFEQGGETFFYSLAYTWDYVRKFSISKSNKLVLIKKAKSDLAIAYNNTDNPFFRLDNHYCFTGRISTPKDKYDEMRCYSLTNNSSHTYKIPLSDTRRELADLQNYPFSHGNRMYLQQYDKMRFIYYVFDIVITFHPQNSTAQIDKKLFFTKNSTENLTKLLHFFIVDQQKNTIAVLYNKTKEERIFLFKQGKFFEYLTINSSSGIIKQIYKLKKNNLFIFGLNDNIHKTYQISNIIQIVQFQSFKWLIACAVIAFILICVLIVGIAKSIKFVKIMLLQEIRCMNIIFEVFSILSIYFFTFLRAYSTNSSDVDFLSPDGFSKNRLIGSFYMTLLYFHFIFSALVLIIFESYHQNQVASKHLNYYMNHGLKILDLISYVQGRIHIKSLCHSFASVSFILWLENTYCQPVYSVLQINEHLLLLIVAFHFCMVSTVGHSVVITRLCRVYWFSISLIIFLVFSLSFFTQTFYLETQVKNLEMWLTILWSPTLFSSISQSLFQIQFRYTQSGIGTASMLIIALIHVVVSSLVYFLILKIMRRKKDFADLQMKKGQFNETILTSRMSQSSIPQQQAIDQEQIQEPLLSVYIPQKMNLKARLQKNKVLKNIKFAASQGQIISFIDFQNQSKKALFAILINEQKSDSFIEKQLFGEISYSKKVKLSYCYDSNIYFPQLTIQQHLKFYFSLKKDKQTTICQRQAVNNIMRQFNILEQYHNKKAKNLSGGYLKKMCLACAFIGDPSVVLLDEPTVGIDLKFRKIFWEKLKNWKQDRLILVFTSNVEEAQTISDKVWFFQKAKIYDFYELKNRKKKLELTFQFLNNHSYEKGRGIIKKFTDNNQAFSSEKYISGNLSRQIKLVYYGIETEERVKNIKQLIEEMRKLNEQKFQFHFDLRILNEAIDFKELIRAYEKSSCNQCDRKEILGILKAEFNKEQDDNIINSFLKEQNTNQLILQAQQTLNLFFKTENKAQRFLWLSQIKSTLLRRWFFYNAATSSTVKLLMAQLYFWIHIIGLLLISNSYVMQVSFEKEFIMRIMIVMLLNTKFYHFYAEQVAEDHLEYYKSIGMDWKNYWIGNFIFELSTIFLPLFISFTILNVLLSVFSIQRNADMWYYSLLSFIYAVEYVLAVISLSFFKKNETNSFALIMTFTIYPIYISENFFLKSFHLSENSVYDYLQYFFFPWSVNYLTLSGNIVNQWLVYVSLFGQILIMVLFIYIMETLKNIKKNKQGHLYFREEQNTSNDFIDKERKIIQDIEDKQQYIIGDNLTHMYQQNFSLKNMYFNAKIGQMIGIFGHNGSGKTTFFKVILNRLRQTSGIIEYFGQRKQQMKRYSKIKIGYCPQIDHLDHSLTLQQNIRTIGKIKGLTDESISIFITVFTKYLKFEGNQQVKISDLSVNERKKANFIIAFLGFPKAIVMDETSTGIDQNSSERFLTLLRIYSHKYNKIVILTSHNVKQGQNFCDKVTIMKNGSIKASGTPFQLKMSVQQQLYKLIVHFSRKINPVVRQKQREKVSKILSDFMFKNMIFQDQFRVGYNFDMNHTDIYAILTIFLDLHSQNVVERFQLYKHDLEEVAKYCMSQVDDTEASVSEGGIRRL